MSAFRDRVRDTTTTTGTGDITLSGTAPTGFQAFASAYSVGEGRIPYAIVAVDGTGAPTGAWEVGFAVLSASTTLQRSRILASSNAGAAVSFAAGTKDVFTTIPAYWASQLIQRGRSEMMRAGAFTR